MKEEIKEIKIDFTVKDLKIRYKPLSESVDKVAPLINELLDEIDIDEYINDILKSIDFDAFGLKKHITPYLCNGLLNGYKYIYFNEYSDEITTISKMMDCDFEKLCLINCYYDFLSAAFKSNSVSNVIKVIRQKLNPFGCTAFAYNTEKGPVHARNMDWIDPNGLLANNTVIVNHKGRLRENSFKTISWPGVSGVLSAIKPKYFTVTLNMTSCDEFSIGQPVVFLIRKVCERAKSFDEAVEMLSKEEILSDCLLLVTGTKNGEMVVIERTPTNSAIRYPVGDYIAVANGYIKYKPEIQNDQFIVENSKDRYSRITELLEASLPKSLDNCFDYLSDENVRMSCTIQQMVMCAGTGELKARIL